MPHRPGSRRRKSQCRAPPPGRQAFRTALDPRRPPRRGSKRLISARRPCRHAQVVSIAADGASRASKEGPPVSAMHITRDRARRCPVRRRASVCVVERTDLNLPPLVTSTLQEPCHDDSFHPHRPSSRRPQPRRPVQRATVAVRDQVQPAEVHLGGDARRRLHLLLEVRSVTSSRLAAREPRVAGDSVPERIRGAEDRRGHAGSDDDRACPHAPGARAAAATGGAGVHAGTAAHGPSCTCTCRPWTGCGAGDKATGSRVTLAAATAQSGARPWGWQPAGVGSGPDPVAIR